MLLRHGLAVPQACSIRMHDPKVLAWMHKPQLVQRDEKEIESYTLQACLLLWLSCLTVMFIVRHQHVNTKLAVE